MYNQDALNEYSDAIKSLRKQCFEAGMTEEDFRKVYYDTLDAVSTTTTAPPRQDRGRFVTRRRVLLILLLPLLCALYNHKIIYSWIVCNLQDYVYPGLKILRRVSMPFVSLFPSLTHLYYESCLIQNPFFTVVDMDCWPCSITNNVQEINDPKPVYLQQHSAPFIYETEQQTVNLEILSIWYHKYKNTVEKESTRVLVNNRIYINPEELFRKTVIDDKNLYVWRLNNMNIARLLRQLVPRPKVVPRFGQSTERFLIIDSSQGQFHVPDTECNFSFLLSLSGTRTVHLVPAEECKTQCRTLKIDLKETYLLWYNWWYWRPIVQPSTGNETLIAHVGSYC